MPADDSRALDALLDFLKRNRGFDFTGYKRTTLERRLQKRMQSVGAESYERYLDVLEAQPDEFTQLFDTLLINVTRFFRDDAPWQFLAEELVPTLLASRSAGAPIRVWSAGCATGEEAYTLAMVLAEALGMDAFRERVKIYATDVDEQALATARVASYDARQVADVPAPLLERYFERAGERYTFRKELRRSVIFGRNDLVQDAPISRIDLLVCRNTLMYFNAATQAAILRRFHFALADGGILFLGRAETLLSNNDGFAALDLRRRMFVKASRAQLNGRESPAATEALNGVGDGEGDGEGDLVRVRDAAFEAGSTAQVVIDRTGRVVLANQKARSLFALQPADIGRLLQDLELSYRPVELRSLIEQCYGERRPVVVRETPWRERTGSESRWLDVELDPLVAGDSEPAGVSVSFVDATARRQLRHELEESRQKLEAAYAKLQSTNEELETTNEELQSTVEELETTNEELQSTNEELETMNEELHSMNEELQGSNDELQRSSSELNEVNAFLEGVFAALRGGVAVVGPSREVLVWNAGAEELWGVRGTEAVGTDFMRLDIGLPVAQLDGLLRETLAGRAAAPVQVPATNRRGRRIECRVAATALASRDGKPRGVILVMEEMDASH